MGEDYTLDGFTPHFTQADFSSDSTRGIMVYTRKGLDGHFAKIQPFVAVNEITMLECTLKDGGRYSHIVS